MDVRVAEKGCDSVRSSLTTAASDSGLRLRSQRAMRTERVWRSRPVSRMLDMWNAKSSDSLAVRVASGSIDFQGRGTWFGSKSNDFESLATERVDNNLIK